MSKSTAKNQLKRALSRELFRNLGVESMTEQQWQYAQNHFDNKCAYCGKSGDLTREHLVGINQNEVGTDHPSNIVPAHLSCQARKKVKVPGTNDSQQTNWQNHIRSVWQPDAEVRIRKIKEYQKNFSPINGAKGKRRMVRAILREADSQLATVLQQAVEKAKTAFKGL